MSHVSLCPRARFFWARGHSLALTVGTASVLLDFSVCSPRFSCHNTEWKLILSSHAHQQQFMQSDFLFGTQVVMKQCLIVALIFISLIIPIDLKRRNTKKKISEGRSEVNGNRGLPL